MNKKRLVVLMAIFFTAMSITINSTQEAGAIGGFMKNKLKGKAKSETTQQINESTTETQAEPEQKQPPASSEPLVYENNKFHYKVTYPGNWELKDDNPKKTSVSIIDTWGKMGNMAINSTWMSDNFPVDPAVKALITQAEQRKKHGELEDYYIKNYTIKDKNGKDITLVKGVVVIESDEDPDIKRMQWQAYGGGNYYNFMTSTSVAKFPEYRETFKNMIDSIEFDFSEGSFK